MIGRIGCTGGNRWAAPAAAAALVMVVVACSGSDETEGTVPPTPVVTATTDAPRPDDGVLRIGVMAPRSGPGAPLGESLLEASALAIELVNEAGGVGGAPVQRIEEDEGTTPLAAADAIESLLDQDVDAVIGPTSSVIALDALGDLLAGGVVACSPTATTMALDDYPGSDRFFRTAPSDALQAVAIAELAERTGARTAAVAFIDDTYGRPLAQATIAALEGRQLAVDTTVPLAPGDDDLTAEAMQLAHLDVGVIVIIGDPDAGTRLLSALGASAAGREGGEIPEIILNGAMRTPAAPTLVQELPPALREAVQGVSPVAGAATPGELPGPFATNTVDCVNLLALAAVQAGSDNPVQVADQVQEVSSTGVTCADFAGCAGLLGENRNIDYEGQGGGVEIGETGDPEQARFEAFGFDVNGVDQPIRTFSVAA